MTMPTVTCPFSASTRCATQPPRSYRARPAIDMTGKQRCVISAGGLSGILNTLLATLEPGDEVLMTDPTYVGLINRVRLAGGVPRFVPMTPTADGWVLDVDALAHIDPAPIAAALLMSPSMPTGAVFTSADWLALCEFCSARTAG